MEALHVNFPQDSCSCFPSGFLKDSLPQTTGIYSEPQNSPDISICPSHLQQPLGSLPLWLCERKCPNHQPLKESQGAREYRMLHSIELMSNTRTFSRPKTWTQNLTKNMGMNSDNRTKNLES